MIKDILIEILKSSGIEASRNEIEIPQEEFGDFSYPCFNIAKKLKKDPGKIAEEACKRIKHEIIKKIEIKGGYINFFLNWEKICEKILRECFKKINLGNGKRVMVEFSQPNPVHPMHIGHARTTFLGESLANILENVNYKVLRANYINDTGLQVAKLIKAYLKWAKNQKPKGKPDFWLWNLYVKFHEEALKDPLLENEAREILRKIEIEKDKKAIKILKKIVRWCVQGFKKTYKDLGIKFDIYFYETDFKELGKEIVEEALKKGIAFKSAENTIVANLENYGLANAVLLRSDGTGLYITSDLGLTFKKFQDYKLDECIWVVSSQQILHFKQLFKILELLGYDWAKNCYHFHFEHVVLPEGKMSSREGRAIMLDEVVEKLKRLAYEEVEKRNPKLGKKIKEKIAREIAICALKYSVLKIEPEDQITFDWKKMLSFQGNTGPYLQYAYARCSSILRKAKKWKRNYKPEKLEKEEIKLLKKISFFPEILENAAISKRPNYICNYLYEIATIFNEFYEKVPVLKAEGNLRNFRLTLVSTIRELMKKGLGLLGIKVLERM